MPMSPEMIAIREAKIAAFQNMLLTWSKNHLSLDILTGIDGNDEYLAGKILDTILGKDDGMIKAIWVRDNFGWPLFESQSAWAILKHPYFIRFPTIASWGLAVAVEATLYIYDKYSDIVNNLGSISFEVIRGYLNAAQTPKLLQYKSMHDLGYLSDSEFFAWSGCRSWEDFYERVGLDPKAQQLKAARENGSINNAQLMNGLHLNSMDKVEKLYGTQWTMALEFKENLATEGVTTEFSAIYDMIGALRTDLMNAGSEVGEAFEDLCALLNTEDGVPMTIGDLAGAIDQIMPPSEGNEQMAAALSSSEPIFIASNAFADTDNKGKIRKTKPESMTEDLVRTDLIQSNIALAMRQLEPADDSVGNFYTSDRTSNSFLTVSFASPFESNLSQRNRS